MKIRSVKEYIFIIIFIIILFFLYDILCYYIFPLQKKRKKLNKNNDNNIDINENNSIENPITIGFFHPYCDSGGGGERVLWIMIASLLQNKQINNQIIISIYTGDIGKNKEKILSNVKDHFRIDLSSEEYSSKINFIYIRSRSILEAKWYPIATMLFQSLSSIIVGFECLLMNLTPEIFVDTTGHAFIYPLARICGVSKVVAYVHYPIISSDMLNKVREQRPSYNNDSRIASSVTISKLKLFYYNFIAKLYSFVGSFADNVMVNSSWTAGHISNLWDRQINNSNNNNNNNNKFKKGIIKLYPPCNTSHLQQIPLQMISSIESTKPLKSRERIILSIGQFRPEKDHFLQLKLFKELLLGEGNKESEDDNEFVLVQGNNKYSDVRLVMLGSVRHKDDEELVNKLKKEASLLGIEDNVDFVINAPYTQMLEYLRISSIGLHTMWNEHFGISIVEMMAAGLVVVAHKSAGPLMDIVVPIDNEITGYLASSSSEYAQCIGDALDNFENLLTLRERGRMSCARFSDESFTNITISEFTYILDSFYDDKK